MNSINQDENESKRKKSTKRGKKKSQEQYNSNMYVDTDENLFDTPWSEWKPHPSPKKTSLEDNNHLRILSAPVSTKNSNKIENVLNQKAINNQLVAKYGWRNEDKMKGLLWLHSAALVIQEWFWDYVLKKNKIQPPVLIQSPN